MRQRALQRKTVTSKAKIEISHLSRQHKHLAIFDRQRQFQIQCDFEGLVSEVNRERKRVYVDRQSMELLRTAPHSIAINASKWSRYLTRSQHEARILKEKQDEENRKVAI